MLFVQKLFSVRKRSKRIFTLEQLEKPTFGVESGFKRYLRNAFIRIFKQKRRGGKSAVGNYCGERFSVIFYYDPRSLFFA